MVARGIIIRDVEERASIYDVPVTAIHMSECETQIIFRPSLMGPDSMVRQSFSTAVPD